jgi:hypothetical protein
VTKTSAEDIPRAARSYIDEALKIQTKHGQSSKASKEDYARALADAEEAFGQLASVRRISESSTEKQAA